MKGQSHIRRVSSMTAACLLLLVAGVSHVSAQSGDGSGQRGSSIEQVQTSRAEELLAKRRERLANVTPAKPSAAVDFLATAETDGFDQLVSLQKGYFRFGLGKISPVSSFTPAVRYERPRLGDTELTFRAAGAYSTRGYQVYDLKIGMFDVVAPYDFLGDGFLGAPFDFDQRATRRPDSFLYGDFRYNNLPREEFFGLGPDSSRDDRTEYRLEQTVLDLVGGHQFARWVAVEGRVGFMKNNVGPGSTDTRPSSEALFDPANVPGLGEQDDFLHFDGGLYLAWEADPNLPSGVLGLRFARFNGQRSDRFNFNRYSIDARGYLPLGSRQRVVATRFYASRDVAADGSEVPFYLMKTLGGHETLRGFRDFRFRDTNLMYISGEYRWEATAGVELAAFYDTGKVFPDRAGFTFDGLRHSAGGGIRFKSLRRVVFRLDVGTGSEGALVYFAVGPSF